MRTEKIRVLELEVGDVFCPSNVRDDTGTVAMPIKEGPLVYETVAGTMQIQRGSAYQDVDVTYEDEQGRPRFHRYAAAETVRKVVS